MLDFIYNSLSSDNTTSLHFATQHEGYLQVSVPCAVLTVVTITALIITLIAFQGRFTFQELFTLLAISINAQLKQSSGD